MGEIIDISWKVFDHWWQYKDQCERGVILAEQNLARIAIKGQLQFDYDMQNLQEVPQEV